MRLTRSRENQEQLFFQEIEMKLKNLLSVTFVLLIVSLLVVTPVFAGNDEECSHADRHTIASLRACVVHAVDMKHIDNQGVANSLLAKLDTALAASKRGQTHVVVAKLKAFIHEVEAQAGKHIDGMHVEHMVMHTQKVIQDLS
jgi:hypothetical protein